MQFGAVFKESSLQFNHERVKPRNILLYFSTMTINSFFVVVVIVIAFKNILHHFENWIEFVSLKDISVY